MRKKICGVIAIIVILMLSYLLGTGFMKNPNVALGGYYVSEDGSEITLNVGVWTSMGYIRDFKDNGGGVKPHYLTFYSTFGGLNSSLGSKSTFTLELSPNDTEIFFNRTDGGYELVLVKDEVTGQWRRPSETENQQGQAENNDTITYNGKEYLVSELCNATLQWLELSDQERMLSSYFPPEFVSFVDTWGVSLTVENITPTGIIIKCTQSGGNPTGELQTGSWYILQEWTQEYGWVEVDNLPLEYELAWTQEAWIIPMNDTCEWEVEWEWLYGSLSEGKYRIGKEITDFRETGDYDEAIYYAEFEIVK